MQQDGKHGWGKKERALEGGSGGGEERHEE